METITLNKAPITIPVEADVTQRCQTAKELANIGEYEAAVEALAGVWNGELCNRPLTEGLPPADRAELLLRVGALAGCLGSSGQIPGTQEFAKDLISESIRAFVALGDQEKIAEAQTDLAICYWRAGAMDEGRVWFRDALTHATAPTTRVRVLVNSTLVELSTNHLSEALALLDQAAPMLKDVEDNATIGRYYMNRAVLFKEMGGAENLDRALIDNTAASVYFEKANHRRYFARVENNIGGTYLYLGRYDEALEHLEKAHSTFVELKDVGTAAQVNETRARVFIAQQRYVEAEKMAFCSAAALEAGDEQSLLAEALEAQGIALARLGRHQSALATLKRAAEVAETAGDPAFAGRTFLTIIEELREILTPNDVRSFYHDADRLLGDQLSSETAARLRSCARLLSPNADGAGPESLPKLSFQDAVLRCESDLIKRALDDAQGSVTRAAKVLGLTHQGLCYIINHRHKTLLSARAPIRVRRKSLIKKR
jgi:tetratricopeptide (TPR) repeat protein